MPSCDIAVVGAGLIGASISLRLAQAGLRVTLIERQQPGREASWAAAGMLSPGPETPGAIPLVPFGRASLALYPQFVEEVEQITGRRTGYRAGGALELFFSGDAERELSTLIALHHGLGLPTEPLSVDEARRFEPALSRELRAAAWLPYEAWVDNRALTEVVLDAAQRAGAELLPETRVSRLVFASGRCAGVVADGRTISSGAVVIAAGAFSAEVEGLVPRAATRPIRGQMAAVLTAQARVGRVLRSRHCYLVPRDDAPRQRVVVGSTTEDAGFEKCVTPRGLEQILAGAQEILPALGGAAVVETWSGLRPDTPDHLPLLGPAACENVLLATGHYRNGILLAPITAKLVAEWITEHRVSLDWEIFSPLRFARAQAAGELAPEGDAPAQDARSSPSKL